jgi:hypothetical protein
VKFLLVFVIVDLSRKYVALSAEMRLVIGKFRFAISSSLIIFNSVCFVRANAHVVFLKNIRR